jgi:hypothetical protein
MLRTLKPQESVVKVMKWVREVIQKILLKEVTKKKKEAIPPSHIYL